jgi:hypothetical protein
MLEFLALAEGALSLIIILLAYIETYIVRISSTSRAHSQPLDQASSVIQTEIRGHLLIFFESGAVTDLVRFREARQPGCSEPLSCWWDRSGLGEGRVGFRYQGT